MKLSRIRKKSGKKEQKLQTITSDYIRNKYPDVIFKCDVAAGLKLTPGMAMLAKRWRSDRGQCDVDIDEPMGQYHGLKLELKTIEGCPFKKDGGLRKDEHLEEQADMHLRLIAKGYFACFVVGADHTKAVIDWYMQGAVGECPAYIEKKVISLFV